jgi:hypothetical protein
MRDGQQPEVRPSVLCSPRSPNKPRECTGKCRQFNGFCLVQTGSGPGGRWFKSTRPDQLFYKQQLTGARIVVECLVADQALSGSNPFDPITLLSLKPMRYAAFSTAISTSFLWTIRTTSQHPCFCLGVRTLVEGESLMPIPRQLSSLHLCVTIVTVETQPRLLRPWVCWPPAFSTAFPPSANR